MILPDVNVLIYAFRQNAPEHALCKAWLETILAGDANFGMSPLALAAVVRVTTGLRPYAEASTSADVIAFCNYLLERPNCRIIEPGRRHWEIFSRLCIETLTRGPIVTDAWYAALAIESGCEWITMDRDFARFPGLRWSTPKAQAGA